MHDTTVGGQHFENRTITFFFQYIHCSKSQTLHTNQKKKIKHSKIPFCFQTELFACVWTQPPFLRGFEHKQHFNLTSCSSFKLFCMMKVMLFTVPNCPKACLYLVCACVCKSIDKSLIYFTLQSSQVFQTNWLFILCQVSSLSSWNLHLWKKRLYTHLTVPAFVYIIA